MTEPDTASRSYPCATCGAALEYAPGTHAMRCPYCGDEHQIAPVPRQVRERPLEELASLPAKPVAASGSRHTFRCPHCQAQTESDTLSVKCQFCATPLVADATAIERIVPEAVVPFALDRAAARDALRAWAASRWFAPNSLKKVTEAETSKGSYLPHWTYDADTVSRYTGSRGEHYWETETHTVVRDGQTHTETRQVQRTHWYPARGTVEMAFDDVLVAGTSRLPEQRLDALEPWPLAEARPYQEEYLAGFQTVRYDIEPETGLERAKQHMDSAIRSEARRDIGGDEQQVHSVDTRYHAVTFKLLLLPVWLLTYIHAGRAWQVMVNARTGEVIGDRPYSRAKIALAAVSALLLVALTVLLYLHFR